MPEPITILGGAALTAYLSKDGVSKLLGPTAEYLGGELKSLVTKCQQNIASVFKKAEKKCGDKLDNPGMVNPRVMKHIYDEAKFSDNELLAEYFGGVLASSRTDDGKDDRGVYFSQIIKSLSSYQLRLHYLFYYLIWFHSKNLNIDFHAFDKSKLNLIVPINCYLDTFKISETNKNKEMSIITHSLNGLLSSDLICSSFAFQSQEYFKKINVEVEGFAFQVEPSITGIELFIWVHGQGEMGLNAFSLPTLAENPDLEIKHISQTKFSI